MGTSRSKTTSARSKRRSPLRNRNVGHTVYLDGKADSWVARQAAEDTAWNAPGVNMVIDRLEVA